MEFSPEELADKFGIVHKENYLAHTIRDIEKYILQKFRIHYHILTYTSQIKNKSKCEFFDNGCVIRLPINNDNIQDNEIRLRLAHELGHIVKNITKLQNPELLQTTTEDEEIYAWVFAFNLIKRKSDTYREKNYTAFIFTDDELGAVIQGLVKNKSQFVQTELAKSIPFIK